MAHKILPKNLRKQAAGRSEAAKIALQEAMVAWWRDLEERDFDIEDLPTMKDVQLRAGLSEKFLYGPKHKRTTKILVENWIERVRKEIDIRKNAKKPLKNSKDSIYWEERYNKLARYANLWFVRMRQLQKQIKDLERRLDAAQIGTGDVNR